jgi:predicted acylesterase/phospholipase RssA
VFIVECALARLTACHKQRGPEAIGGSVADERVKILSLDGGGAKGFYTLGVLREVEAMMGGGPLSDHFRLIFGTSTGSIIAALLALGYKVNDIYELYRDHVPKITKPKPRGRKSQALAALAHDVFKEQKFDAFKTDIGIVATKWMIERPMIFKANIDQAHGRKASFVPGFGCTIADVVQASCSAYPFFDRKVIYTAARDRVELVDGGYCANNPTLYAIADATVGLQIPAEILRVLSIGVGTYPEPKRGFFSTMRWVKYLRSVQLLQKTLEINTQSMDQLRFILFRHINTIRISDTFDQPEMATDLFEHDLHKLNLLRQRGVESFAKKEADLREQLL